MKLPDLVGAIFASMCDPLRRLSWQVGSRTNRVLRVLFNLGECVQEIYSEEQMRKALGLAETRPKKARTEASQPVRYTIVELSVRKDGAGLPLRFEHRSRSISKVTAQLEAEKEAKRQGYQVWALLDIRQI